MTNTVYWEDHEVGHIEWGTEVVADKEEMLDYGRRYEPWSFHVDEDAAAHTPFGGLIASGGYIIALWYLSGQSIWFRDCQAWAFLGGFDWQLKVLLPMRPDDRLHASGRCWRSLPSASRDGACGGTSWSS